MTDDNEYWHRGIGEWDEDELVFHHGGKITRKRMLISGGAAAGALAAGPILYTTAYAKSPEKALPYKAHTNVKGHITFWHIWSSPLRRGAIHTAIKEFRKRYPHITVTDLPIPFGDLPNKLHAAVAAGKGMPDVTVADRPSFWVDARVRLYDPLTAFAKRDSFKGGNIFFPFTWYESNVKIGKTTQLVGLPFETDTKLLYWNRAAFMDAGLNPNKPPQLWSQLGSYASKLDSSTRATFWPQFGMGLGDWPWTNASDWQTKKMRPTVNAARNVQAANFEKQWVDRYGGLSGYKGKIVANNQSGKDEFESGNLAIAIAIPTYHDQMTALGIKFIPTKGAKAGQNIYPFWGTSTIVHSNTKGAKPYSFSGGFALGMPRSSHRSKGTQDAAWEFIKYMSLVGQLTFEQFVGNVPCVKSMMNDPFLRRKPQWPATRAALKYGHAKIRNYYDPTFPQDIISSPGFNAENKILEGGNAKTILDQGQQEAIANMKRNGMP